MAQAPDPASAREQLNQTIPFERRTTAVQEIYGTQDTSDLKSS